MNPERGAWRVGLRAAVLDGRAALALASLFLLLQLFFLDRIRIPGFAESVYGEIAYHLGPRSVGRMAPDIPWGAEWSLGVGRLFLLVHNRVYQVLGVGTYSCRLVSTICNLLQLLLLYRWARRCFDPTIARLSAFFLAVSTPFWYFAGHDGGYTAMIGLFAFSSFFYQSRALLEGRARDAFRAGLCCGLAVDVNYRGILIVFVTWVALLLSKKRKERHLWLALGAGSLIAFVWWVSLNVLPVGVEVYLRSVVPRAVRDGGGYTWRTLFSEFLRLGGFAGRWAGALDLGLGLLLIPMALRASLPRRERPPLTVMLRWLALIFAALSIAERSTREDLLLFYAPYLSVLCALGFRRLSERHPAWGISLVTAVLLVVFAEYGGLLYKYKDLDTAAYYHKLRAAVRPGSVVFGSARYWLAFPDQPYYGGQDYLSVLSRLTEELNPPGKYSAPSEAYAALLGFLKKRNIEFVIGCEYLQSSLESFAPGGTLPPKNFALVATIEDPHLGKRWTKASYTTRIYRIVSYEP